MQFRKICSALRWRKCTLRKRPHFDYLSTCEREPKVFSASRKQLNEIDNVTQVDLGWSLADFDSVLPLPGIRSMKGEWRKESWIIPS